MKKLLVVIGAVGLTLLAVTGSAGARSEASRIQIVATMVAADEVPTPKGNVGSAGGSFTATLTKSDTGGALNWQLSFGSLTGDAVAAHIHIAARGVAGPVVVPLCTPCTSGVTGTANINATVLEAIQNDRAYVNVHTKTNPAGEIRGQVSPADEPEDVAAGRAGAAEAEGQRSPGAGCVHRDDHEAGLVGGARLATDVQPTDR